MFSDIGQHGNVYAGGRYQRQNLASGGFDGHQRAHLPLHELLPVLLEGGIDGGDDILPRNGLFVHFAILVGLLYLVEGVAQVDVVSFLSAQLFFTGRLDARHAGVVSALVFSRMGVHIGLVHLGNIAQQVATRVYRVVADAAHLAAEAGEAVFHLIKTHVRFGREVADHGDGLEADAPAAFVVFHQAVPDKAGLHIQNGSQRQGVEGLHLAGRDQNVISHFVAHQDGPVAVVDDSAGGIDGLIDGGVAVCVLLVLAAEQLEGEDFPQQKDSHDAQAHQQADMPAIGAHLRESEASTGRVRSDTRKPATSDAPKRAALNHSGRVPAPSAQM